MQGLLRKKNDLGKALFNLTINISCHKKTFEDHSLMSAICQIEIMGMAIHKAKKMLEGSWQVTEQGYLIRGTAENMENRTAVLDIEDAATGLETLEKIMDGRIKNEGFFPRPHLHFENGGIADVGGNEKGLYIVGINQEWYESVFGD